MSVCTGVPPGSGAPVIGGGDVRVVMHELPAHGRIWEGQQDEQRGMPEYGGPYEQEILERMR